MQSQKNNLKALLPEINIKENQPLSPLCTLGVGGVAEYFAAPDSFEELEEILKSAKNYEYEIYILGGGSNLIFPDGLIHGLVISTQNLNSISWKNNFTADIQAGFKLSHLMKISREKNLGGLEFAAGIPGTLGGSIFGNSGAVGRSICEFLESVKAIDSHGNLKTYTKKDFSFKYRECSLSKENIIIIEAEIKFNESLHWDNQEYGKFLSLRKNQPLNFKSAGCTFKNPEGNSAGKLLDQAGCKNLCCGDAIVSDKHANFILNIGNASASDVLNLIETCSKKVYGSTGIKLEQEIKNAVPCFLTK